MDLRLAEQGDGSLREINERERQARGPQQAGKAPVRRAQKVPKGPVS